VLKDSGALIWISRTAWASVGQIPGALRPNEDAPGPPFPSPRQKNRSNVRLRRLPLEGFHPFIWILLPPGGFRMPPPPPRGVTPGALRREAHRAFV